MSEKVTVQRNELICLILMLIPIISIIGFILYFIWIKPKGLKLVVAILTIFFGLIPDIFLWLDAFNVLKLDKTEVKITSESN